MGGRWGEGSCAVVVGDQMDIKVDDFWTMFFADFAINSHSLSSSPTLLDPLYSCTAHDKIS